jgi:two-component system phosphate regulon sensor histidine kinase PhoR
VRVGLRLKLFLVSFGLTLASFIAADLYIEGSLDAAAADRLHRGLLLAVVLAGGAAFVMSSLAAFWMARLVRALTVAARRMAGGDLAVRTHVPGTDEVAELGGALDQLARSLSDAMTQLRSERDLLSGILDGMEEGVLVLDQRGRILRVNPALRSMLLIGSEAIGRPLIEIVRNAELKELVDAARSEPRSSEIDITGLKPRRLLARAAMLPGEDKALLVVCRDVTDVRRLETMRRDFVANVSHELRTPVTAVRSAAETLRDGAYADPDAAKRFVDIIARNAERLQQLIEDLLDLSRIESKQLKLSFEPVHVRSFVAHGLSLFRDRAEKRNVQLEAEIPERLPAVYADRRALEQIMSNLVENAVKYCPGARVTVRAREVEPGIEIVVADTGPGIDAKHVPRIFERFYRVDAGRSRELGGTGLGLSIVKHLAEAMGGTIAVDSSVGTGTSFTLLLPRANRHERVAEQAASA